MERGIRQVIAFKVELTASMIKTEKDLTIEIVKHIGELDRLDAAVNYKGGMYWDEFAEKILGLTPDQFTKRVRAARVMRKYPDVEDMIRRGELHLSHAWMIYAKITPSNAKTMLDGIRGTSKRAAEAFLSRITPSGEILDKEPEHEIRLVLKQSELEILDRAREVLAARGRMPTMVDTLLKAAEDLLDKRDPVRKAKRAQARQEKREAEAQAEKKLAAPAPGQNDACVPKGDDQQDHHRAGIVEGHDITLPQPSPEKPAPGQAGSEQRSSRSRVPVPAALMHALVLRDEGRCTHVFPDGSRCRERGMLEVDHLIPVALGGETSVDNTRLLCRLHNFEAATVVFGQEKMAHHREAGRFSSREGGFV